MPPPIRREKGKMDMNKYCHFHVDYGHEINQCNYLKDEIEFLLRLGKLRKFKSEKPKEGGGDDHNQASKGSDHPHWSLHLWTSCSILSVVVLIWLDKVVRVERNM